MIREKRKEDSGKGRRWGKKQREKKEQRAGKRY